jgi:hypothetical protein
MYTSLTCNPGPMISHAHNPQNWHFFLLPIMYKLIYNPEQLRMRKIPDLNLL